jgi:hypothetical protein
LGNKIMMVVMGIPQKYTVWKEKIFFNICHIGRYLDLHSHFKSQSYRMIIIHSKTRKILVE